MLMLGTISFTRSFRWPMTAFFLDPIEGWEPFYPLFSFDLSVHPDEDIKKSFAFLWLQQNYS